MADDRSKEQSHGLLPEALRAITVAVASRPHLTLCIVGALAVAAVAITWGFLGFKTDRADLIDPEADFHKRWLAYSKTFGDESDLVVVVESDEPARIPPAIEDLGRRMEQEPQFFQAVLYKLDVGRVPAEKGLQYRSPAELNAAWHNVKRLSPLLAQGGRPLATDRLFSGWSAEFDALRSRPAAKQREALFKRVEHYTAGMAGLLDNPGEFQNPWPPLLPGSLPAAPQQPSPTYFVNASGTMGFMNARPAGESDGFDGATPCIDRLRKLIGEVQAKHPGVRIGMTGIPVLENDEMRRSRADMSRAAVVSFVGVGLLLMLGFRGLRHPLLALSMLAVGMAWAFGYTTIIVGHLNILSISFAVILIGLGIDFAIHYLARYLELRRTGDELHPALAKTSSGVGVGIVAAAVTTAFAFFTATFTKFLGVAELGIIAGGGILLCAAATFVVLPALIATADRNVQSKDLPRPIGGDLFRGLTSRFPGPVAVLSILLIAGIASQLVTLDGGRFRMRLEYDSNLLNLQADGLESVETQKRVFESTDHSLLYAVSIAEGPAEARALKAKYAALHSVAKVEELASALPAASSEQTTRTIRAIRTRLAGIAGRPPTPPMSEPSIVGKQIEQFYLRIRNLRAPAAKRLARTIDRFLNQFERYPLPQQRAFLAEFQNRSAAALHAQMVAISSATNPEPVTLADLPPALTSRFVSSDGKWLVQVYPKENIWEAAPLAKFVEDVRTVDPEVTGTPLQNLEAARQIKSSYKTASVYAFAVIFLVLLINFLRRDFTLFALLAPLAVIAFTLMTLRTRRIEFDPLMLVLTYVGMCIAIAAIFDFRNLRDALFAMLPPVGGGLMTFGGLGLLGVDLNPANLIALPLVLGIGVDDGVHIVHDFRSQRGRYRTSPSTMNAIVLTSLTSMVGFGSMMIAAHRGLYTVGLVLVIGVGSCLFVSLVTLPALLAIVSDGPAPAEAKEAAQLRRSGFPA